MFSLSDVIICERYLKSPPSNNRPLLPYELKQIIAPGYYSPNTVSHLGMCLPKGYGFWNFLV